MGPWTFRLRKNSPQFNHHSALGQAGPIIAILDALNEVDEVERQYVLEWIETTSNATHPITGIQVLVMSQNKTDIETRLRNFGPCIYLVENEGNGWSVYTDILNYDYWAIHRDPRFCR